MLRRVKGSSRDDFDFLFDLQEVVDNLVKVDFLFTKEPRQDSACVSCLKQKKPDKLHTLPSGVLGPLYGSTSPSLMGHSS